MTIEFDKYFDLSKTIAFGIFRDVEYPWEVLNNIELFIPELGKNLSSDEYDHPKKNVWIAKDAVIADSAFIGENIIIDHGADIRHCAFIRENAIIGKNSTVGNSTELKNVILFDGVQIPHYNYVGDSVLGYHVHFGAGALVSNFRQDHRLVKVKTETEVFETNRDKVGAFVGDFAEIGCNSVLNPGTVIGKNSNVYPLSNVRGYVPSDSIYKDKDRIVKKF